MSLYQGKKVSISIFGRPHGPAVGVTVEGLPAGEKVDFTELKSFMRRRAPGGALSTSRHETDEPRILCGLQDGCLSGGELTAVLENTDVRPKDYETFLDVPRPGHADYTACVKYEGRQDMRGGGPFSGRMTAPLCTAGGICLQLLGRRGVRIFAHIRSISEVEDRPFNPMGEQLQTLEGLADRELPVLESEAGEKMRRAILHAREEKDSVGGTVECMVLGLPAGLGGPMFEKLESRLATALFAIPAVKGVEFGSGFGAARLKGSQQNDPFEIGDSGRVVTGTNHAGGLLGGITTGMPLVFQVAFKPTPSIGIEQDSVSLSGKKPVKLTVSGRHDPCIVPRGVPVVEAAAAVVLLDEML